MKKILILALVVLAFCFALASCVYGDQTTTATTTQEPPLKPPVEKNHSEGLVFLLEDDGKSYSVIGIGTCIDTEVVIPSSVNSVGTNVYSYCTGLESAVIGNGLTEICDGMFANCKNHRTRSSLFS